MPIVLIGLVVAVAIVIVIWNFRRQAAAREAASAERMKAFMAQAKGGAGHAASETPASRPASDSPRPQASPPPDAASFIARAPLLDAQQTALYQLIKSSLPDHEVMACVSLASFIQPARHLMGFAREAQERRLADATVDFLVCDKTMNAVAAVQSSARSGKAAEHAAFAAACVASSGLRWADFSQHALPRAEDIRRQVLGV